MKIASNISLEEWEYAMSRSAGVVKLVCGVANNAAWLVVLDAHDQIKKHPKYRQRVKQAYKQVMAEWTAYERGLLYARINGFFHLSKMPADIRKKYGNISDAEYYEFWTGIGCTAYMRTRPMVTSLQNKYRLSLLRHGVKHEQELAWVMTAQAALELACRMWQGAIKENANIYHLPLPPMEEVFGCFYLRRVADAWRRAMELTEPVNYALDEIEERNIGMGLDQLAEAWADPMTLYGSTADTAGEYAEIFRTKGEMKKAQREINEIQQLTMQELKR